MSFSGGLRTVSTRSLGLLIKRIVDGAVNSVPSSLRAVSTAERCSHMTDKVCPFQPTICMKNKCHLYIEQADTCKIGNLQYLADIGSGIDALLTELSRLRASLPS